MAVKKKTVRKAKSNYRWVVMVPSQPDFRSMDVPGRFRTQAQAILAIQKFEKWKGSGVGRYAKAVKN